MKLYYYDIYGRAEPIRMLLDQAKIPFEDIRITREECQEMKKKGDLEFNQIPILEMDGQKFSQSHAILKLLGMKYGYYPEDPIQQYFVDSNILANTDVQNQWWITLYTQDPEKQKEAIKSYQENTLTTYLKALQNRLQKNSTQKYIVGDKLTTADFDNVHIAYAYFLNETNHFYKELQEVVNEFPVLLEYYKGLREEMSQHLDKRPSPRPY